MSLFPRRLYLPEVDCSDRSLAIDDGTGLSDRSQKPLIGLKILRQKRHRIATEHACCFFTLEKFNMADELLLF